MAKRRVPQGRGDIVYPAYWLAAAALGLATVLGVRLDASGAVTLASIVFIGGGLPHGAYDIALLRRAVTLDRATLMLAVTGYAIITLLMALLWMIVPLVALMLFLAVAAVHFGEDWQMLDEPLLRCAAGAAVIAAATIGHPAEVSTLFTMMSDPRASVIAQIITAAAPVALLVTAAGVLLAWRDGSRGWAAAMALCFVLLIVLPPVWGFALFFVFLHSPRHLAQTRVALNDMSLTRWLTTGAALSLLAIFGWLAMRWLAPARIDPPFVAQAFQMLASVAVPHLLLSRWLQRRLDRAIHAPPIIFQEKTACA
ncbi:Brp/Blh family beta-carotene 15,15'-dioxygenase [Sphingomonas qilianensis]|uniref:Brp/Blh family beta-carotene 15,15'-dioxygenase n=1 Tax=Sphingomonas qilianensis TaxID=1736690 RepID=UPI003606B7AA